MSNILQERLKQRLSYCPETGAFTWLNGWRAGREACSVSGSGYAQVWLDGKIHLLHRLAFLYMEGELPPLQVDHINGQRLDNRWSNLRHATPAINQRNKNLSRNNTTGIQGVAWRNQRNRWRAEIRVNNEYKHLGHYTTLLDAAAARISAENKHGFTCRR